MFGFKRESVFDTQLVGVDGSMTPVINVPRTLRLAFNWVDGQLAKGREAIRVANLVISEAKRFAGRVGENAAKRDSEIAALRAEVEGLSSALAEARDERDEAVKELQALSDEVDAVLEDMLRGCGKKPRAVKKQKKGK